MDKKELKKAINQLGRVRKSPALDPLDKKQIGVIRKKLCAKINNKDVGKMFLVDIIEKDSAGAPVNVFYDSLIGEYETLDQAKKAAQGDFDYFTPQKQTKSIDYIIYKESNDETDHYGSEIETITFNA